VLGRLGTRGVALAACASLLLATAACRSGSDDTADSGTPEQVRLYGTDGNMQNPFGKEFKDDPSILNGMKGTTPAVPLPKEFKDRLLGIRKIEDYLFTAETYDAVVISALAAQLAGSTDPRAIADQIVGVTNGGEICDSVDVCLRLARDGADIAYRGVSVNRGGFTDLGEPSTASYATLHFNARGEIDQGKTEFVGAGDESKGSTRTPPPPKKQLGGRGDRRDGSPLKLGGLLPRTGGLSPAYPQLLTAVQLAVNEINAAGGVLGDDVVFIEGDDGTNPKTAKATVQQQIRNGVQVIIGAGASSASRAVLPDVVKAGKVLFSPSNTDAGLSSIDDKGLYFRTAAPDNLQSRALADVILRDGSKRIAIIARKDTYGEGLQASVRAELERVGVTNDQVKLLTYVPPEDDKPQPIDFTAGAAQVKAFKPDAVLVIGFFESAQVIKALVAAGVTIEH
jgi:ABC-type branched-subunit amino acid transport system substrate-binding protein